MLYAAARFLRHKQTLSSVQSVNVAEGINRFWSWESCETNKHTLGDYILITNLMHQLLFIH